MITYTREIYSGTVTGNGNSHSTPINTRHEKECQLLLNVTAGSGSLDLFIETHNVLRDTWHPLARFSTITGTGEDAGYIDYGLGEELGISWAVSGNFTFSLDAVFKNK